MGFDMNAAAQFLEGYLNERDRMKSQQRQAKVRKLINQGIQSGKYQPSYKIGAEGGVTTSVEPTTSAGVGEMSLNQLLQTYSKVSKNVIDASFQSGAQGSPEIKQAKNYINVLTEEIDRRLGAGTSEKLSQEVTGNAAIRARNMRQAQIGQPAATESPEVEETPVVEDTQEGGQTSWFDKFFAKPGERAPGVKSVEEVSPMSKSKLKIIEWIEEAKSVGATDEEIRAQLNSLELNSSEFESYF